MFSLSSFVRQALLFVRELLGSDAAIHPRVDNPNAPARTLLQLWFTYATNRCVNSPTLFCISHSASKAVR
jgi:hypothetical protein